MTEQIGRYGKLRPNSIASLCERHGFSRGTFSNMRKRGEGPKITRIGGRVTITPENEAIWIESRSEREPAREPSNRGCDTARAQ